MEDCIEHNQGGSEQVYACTCRKVGDKWSTVGMHRVVYCEAHGITLDDIKGKVVRHKCDNRRCINPNHMEIGSKADNNRDRMERGRSATGRDVYGNRRTTRLSPEDVEFIRSSGLTGKELAARFNVSQGTISLARRKLTHK